MQHDCVLTASALEVARRISMFSCFVLYRLNPLLHSKWSPVVLQMRCQARTEGGSVGWRFYNVHASCCNLEHDVRVVLVTLLQLQFADCIDTAVTTFQNTKHVSCTMIAKLRLKRHELESDRWIGLTVKSESVQTFIERKTAVEREHGTMSKQ